MRVENTDLYGQTESLGLLRGGGLLEEMSEGLAVLPGPVVKPPSLQVVLLSLEVDGDAVIVLRGGVLQYTTRSESDIEGTILDLISPSPTMSAKRSIFACCWASWKASSTQ